MAHSAQQPAPSDSPPWFADGLRFSCTQCGNCCGGGPGNVYVSAEEGDKIAAFLGLSVEEFHRKFTRKEGWRRSLTEQANWDCVFLRPDAAGRKTCTIYEVRPVQCRTWPFWKSNLESRQSWAAAGTGCPGIERGKRHELPVIQAALTANGSLPL